MCMSEIRQSLLWCVIGLLSCFNVQGQSLPDNVIKDLKDLDGRKIAVVAGSPHDEFVVKNYPKAIPLQFKSNPDVLMAVKSGKVDAGLMYQDSLDFILKEDPSMGILAYDVYALGFGMGFQPDDKALITEFNAFLKEIKRDGIYDDMRRRWIKEGSRVMPVINNPNPRGEVRVGIIAAKGVPLAWQQGKTYTGFDIELAERFGVYINKKPVYVDLEVSGLLSAMAARKVDMIGTFAITEERKKRLGLSDVIYTMPASFIALTANLAKDLNTAKVDPAKALAYKPQTFLERLHANIVQEDRYELILAGLGVTVIISLFSTVFGTMVGGVICAMRMSRRPVLKFIAAGYIWIMRGLPVLVLLMIMYYVIFASIDVNAILIATVAFGLNMAAYSSEMFRTAIQSVDRGQTEAGIAGGFSRVQTFRMIVLPQALRHLLPVFKGEVISVVKMTSVVGYIAVQDLTKAADIIRSRTFDAYIPLLTTAVIYLALAWLIAHLLDRVEWRITPRYLRADAGEKK